MNTEHRIKVFRVSTPMLAQMLTAGVRHFEVVENPVPDDATVIGAHIDRNNPTVVIVAVEHPSFEPVALGDMPPEFQPVLKTLTPNV